jgi:hypothetical protein
MRSPTAVARHLLKELPERGGSNDVGECDQHTEDA